MKAIIFCLSSLSRISPLALNKLSVYQQHISDVAKFSFPLLQLAAREASTVPGCYLKPHLYSELDPKTQPEEAEHHCANPL